MRKEGNEVDNTATGVIEKRFSQPLLIDIIRNSEFVCAGGKQLGKSITLSMAWYFYCDGAENTFTPSLMMDSIGAHSPSGVVPASLENTYFSSS